MKHLKFFLPVALAATISSCSPAEQQAAHVSLSSGGPLIKVDKEVHEFGQIKKGADATCFFKVTNEGDEPLIISKCKASCGCTVPDCDQNPIAPGASTDVKVKYDSQKIGPINKTVTITSNTRDSSSVIVRIKGEVIE